jgi:hypothetical protein
MSDYWITPELVTYDPLMRRSWKEGGEWPNADLYYFHEAVVAAHFVLRGYHVLRDYLATRTKGRRSLTTHYSGIFHDVVGPRASAFFMEELDKIAPGSIGQPDLFVFREETANDPRVHYEDPRFWFFVEVKGSGDRIGRNQRAFWREVAKRDDIGLGPQRIRLFRTAPVGRSVNLEAIQY